MIINTIMFIYQLCCRFTNDDEIKIENINVAFRDQQQYETMEDTFFDTLSDELNDYCTEEFGEGWYIDDGPEPVMAMPTNSVIHVSVA